MLSLELLRKSDHSPPAWRCRKVRFGNGIRWFADDGVDCLDCNGELSDIEDCLVLESGAIE